MTAMKRVEAALRLSLAPLMFLGAGVVVDVALRWPVYAERIEYLYHRAGVIKTAGVYGLALAVTMVTLAALFSLPRVGRWMAGLLVGCLFVMNMAYYATIGRFINAEDIRIVQNADNDVYAGAILAYYRPGMLRFIPIGLALAVLAVWAGTRFPGPARTRDPDAGGLPRECPSLGPSVHQVQRLPGGDADEHDAHRLLRGEGRPRVPGHRSKRARPHP